MIFPGGFGTLDELYESLTLIQTGKIRHFPVVLFDSDYWGEMLDWIRSELLADGMISPDDLELLHVTRRPGRSGALVLECYERRYATSRGADKADALVAQRRRQDDVRAGRGPAGAVDRRRAVRDVVRA